MPDWNHYYPHKNSEGYDDPTAYHALESKPKEKNTDENRIKLVISTFKRIAELGGYEIINRIELKEIATGKVYR